MKINTEIERQKERKKGEERQKHLTRWQVHGICKTGT